MARRIIWSNRSLRDQHSIFTYWNKRNKSKSYSRKLRELFIDAVEFVAKNPQTGQTTKRKEVRVKLVKHFAIIYEHSNTELKVLAIFDTRQNPRKMDKLINK